MTKTLTLPEVTTPDALAKQLGWSERRVRDKARELGACRILGNRMILLPAGGRRAFGDSMRNSGLIGFPSFAPCEAVQVCPERLRNAQAKWRKADTNLFPPCSAPLLRRQGNPSQPFATFNGDDEAYGKGAKL